MHDSQTGKPVESSGQLCIAQVGRTHVAFDPVKPAGEFTIIVVLGQHFRMLASGLK